MTDKDDGLDKLQKMSDKQKVWWAFNISLLACLFMLIAQYWTPERLNPAGCLFGIIWMAFGIYAAMGALFIWG